MPGAIMNTIPDYLTRSSYLLNSDNYDIISSTNITICGLGGVGGLAFLSLVRLGFKNFKLVENGIFDEPDLNRQALAFNSTIDEKKLDVYIKYGLDINPDLNIKSYYGLYNDNIHEIIKDSDVIIRVIDHEKSLDTKLLFDKIIREYKKPFFQAAAFGFSSILYNFNYEGMMSGDFWKIFKEKNIAKQVIGNDFILDKMKEHNKGVGFPSISIGVSTASIFLASEILLYVLRETNYSNKKIIFAPEITIINALNMEIKTINILE
jgi:tRNA threonylcarbamoyladenosine dehydratase